jgi:hypothetical protein
MATRRFEKPSKIRVGALAAAILFTSCGLAQAQGILTVTPGSTLATTAGTGVLGYTGDGAAATGGTLAAPSALAYDANGNLYIADADNHVIREVLASNSTITTIAGTGIAGFGGDGGLATSAYLDTPTGVAVDSSGNVYIADAHNQRIREVRGGTITTIAGTGAAGYSGDGGRATSAQLALPSGVAVDSSGTLYIADTNNQRIRKVSGGTITTIAGTGEQNYTGDGAAGASATLDSPTGVAVDAAGNVYIADRHNQRIRELSASGTITTLAGSGAPTFAGSFSGDGASAAAAALAKPTGVWVDASGNVYIADSNNQRIRQVSSGTISSLVGTGDQGFGGDGGPTTAAVLNEPKYATTNASGNLSIADTLNQRIRLSALPILAFGSQDIGIPSTAQSVTLANTGSASISISSIAFSGAFTTITGGTCAPPPVTLAPGTSCTEDIAFLPVATGAVSGSVLFAGTGILPQTILLTGTGEPGSTSTTTTTTLTSSNATALVNQLVTFIAAVTPTGAGTPSGTVTFYAGSTVIGSPQTLSGGTASVTTSFAVAASYAITAVYSGFASFSGSTSAAIIQLSEDFTIASGPGGSATQTVEPGRSATFDFTAASVNGMFSFPIAFTATGLPAGATLNFSPSTVPPGASSVPFTMSVQTGTTAAMLLGLEGFTGATTAMALLLIPFPWRAGRRGPKIHQLPMLFAGFLSLAAISLLSGCGTHSGFFAAPKQTYTINVTGTATGPNGATLQHSVPVTLVVQ